MYESLNLSIVAAGADAYTVTASTPTNSVSAVLPTYGLYGLAVNILANVSDAPVLDSIPIVLVQRSTDSPADGVSWLCPHCAYTMQLDNLANSLLFPTDTGYPVSVCSQCLRLVRLDVSQVLWTTCKVVEK